MMQRMTMQGWKHGIGALMFGMAFQSVAAEECAARSGTNTVPLVELYTSEGCSSCPPADRWLTSRFSNSRANWLAFHVDYWDDIGWPDRFASPAFSQRQRLRVGASGGDTVYTPQVMVGADVRASWRMDGRFDKALLQHARQPAKAGLAMRMQPQGNGWQLVLGAARAAVSRRAAPDDDAAQVWLAQYSDGQTTQVRAGENRGETLHHDRVVRRLYGPWPLTQTLSQDVQLKPDAGRWGVTAFVQDARGNTLQSLSLSPAACDAPPRRSL